MVSSSTFVWLACLPGCFFPSSFFSPCPPSAQTAGRPWEKLNRVGDEPRGDSIWRGEDGLKLHELDSSRYKLDPCGDEFNLGGRNWIQWGKAPMLQP
uniref:Uncharacterized protein n=1 Tax=Arundo donax TaxID=35708 RepID=A0A0A8Y802_ARUDO